MTAVLDSSAVLAYLFEEPGADAVAQILESGAFVSAVNLAEILSKIGDRGAEPESAYNDLVESGLLGDRLVVVPFDAAQAVQAAKLRTPTRPKGLSLGDRACIALSAAASFPAYTADRGWEGLAAGAEIRFVR